jgi:superfamily I DNA/RNA helicase
MDSDGPMMVKGPAGTGKTVVLVHRAKWLLENVFTGNERILITTFNKSLEYTINQMLKSICTPQQLGRMDIVYFDQWLLKVWKKTGGEKILYSDDDICNVTKNLFRLKLTLVRKKGLVDVDRTDEFIEREYDSIVQEYKLRDEASYLTAVRPKKFGVLRQDERRKLWQIFQLVNGDPFDPNVSPAGSSTRMRVINHVTKAIEARKFGIAGKYAAVLVDESQDMGAAEYRLFGALTGNVVGHENPNSLLFAGDGHQRIYGRMGSLISCGINVRGGRTVLLKKCYRSSKALKRYAEKLLDGFLIKDMDDVKETLDGSEALDDGIEPIECFDLRGDYEAMHDATANRIKEWMGIGSKRLSDYAVLLREGNYGTSKTWRLRKTAEAMSKRGLKAVVVSGTDKFDESDSIKVMTMHRAKGMQFYGVVLNLDGWPHKPDKDADEEARKENEEDERKLLYMAIMRAVRFVMLTGVKGRPIQLGKPIPKSKVQSTFDFDTGRKEVGVIKPKKRPVPKKDELVLTKATQAESQVQNAGNDDTAIYEKFIEYLKSTRKNCEDALKYRQDIIQLTSKDKAKMVMAMYFSKQHAAALAPHWSDFAEKYAVTITLEEAASRSASKFGKPHVNI